MQAVALLIYEIFVTLIMVNKQRKTNLEADNFMLHQYNYTLALAYHTEQFLQQNHLSLNQFLFLALARNYT